MKKIFFYIFLWALVGCKEQAQNDDDAIDPCGPMFCCLPPLEPPPEQMIYQDWSPSGQYQLTFFKSNEETMVKLETFGNNPMFKFKIFEPTLFFDIFYQILNLSHCYAAGEPMTLQLDFYTLSYSHADDHFCIADLAGAESVREEIDDLYRDVLNTGNVDETNSAQGFPE